MTTQQLYRHKSIERISSPDQLNDYLKVTKPGVWLVLTAVVVLLAGMIFWAAFAYIGSFAKGTAVVSDGQMTITFEEPQFAKNVKEGMEVSAAGTTGTVTNVSYDKSGNVVARANTTLDNGTYDVSVQYKTTQLLGLLFND
ncbi:MAG: hypothetical protein J5489_00170 [Lachnospiraceae bacterium]|nr:hypothetical protein [Lachnospiraceae bacterium]